MSFYDPDHYESPERDDDEPAEEWVACDRCDGRGYCLDRHDEPRDCPVCGGDGELPADVDIPNRWEL